MRGAGSIAFSVLWLFGIIPACAGSSCSTYESANKMWDHPRVCGEQSSVTFDAYHAPGSSPRVRGAVTYSVELEVRNGIIPACAGSRCTFASWSRRCGDHPRVCGEQSSSWRLMPTRRGSSPRVRGAAFCRLKRLKAVGIIPACAGSRLF